MDNNYLEVANSGMMWLACAPVIIAVLIEAVIFSKKAKTAAKLVELPDEDVKKAFRVGMTSAIGPSLGVFVVMLGLMSVIGGPMAWMRLSVIGAAPTELAATTMAAKAQGLELNSPEYGLINFANAVWVMALNGSAWLFVSGAFTDKLDAATKKISGGDPAKLGILSVTALCGAFSYLFSNEIVKALKDVEIKNYPAVVTGVSAVIYMIIFEKIGKKHPKLKEFNLGIVMVLAMATAVVFKRLFA